MSQSSRRTGLFSIVIMFILTMLLNGCSIGANVSASSGPTSVAVIATAAATNTATAAASPTAPTISTNTTALTLVFDGQRAYEDVKYQVSLGPRTPASKAHGAAVQWMQSELEKNGWMVETQQFNRLGHAGTNVIAKRGTGKPWTILGAHFDARMQANNDPDPAMQSQPVPAANDGASGVAVLMELSRVLPKEMEGEIWLAFFDLEDQGSLPGWDWILGSRALAESLTGQPDAVVIVDMIGDADLNIYQEKNSNKGLTEEIWATAEKLGYQQFIPQERWAMMDDHTPFLEKGIPAVDLIDFDYPFWHTTQDTAEKVSAQSLQAVGDTLFHWLLIRHAK